MQGACLSVRGGMAATRSGFAAADKQASGSTRFPAEEVNGCKVVVGLCRCASPSPYPRNTSYLQQHRWYLLLVKRKMCAIQPATSMQGAESPKVAVDERTARRHPTRHEPVDIRTRCRGIYYDATLTLVVTSQR